MTKDDYFDSTELVLFHKGALFLLLESFIAFAREQDFDADETAKIIKVMFIRGNTPVTVFDEFNQYLKMEARDEQSNHNGESDKRS